MNEILKVRIQLLKELEKKLKKEKIKYYVSGDILLNIYNEVDFGNDSILFEINICSKKIKNIKLFNDKNKILKEFYDSDNNLDYYRYIDKNTLYYDCNDFNRGDESGIYIKVNINSKDYKEYNDIKFNGVNFVVPKNLDGILYKQYGLGYKYLTTRIEKLPKSIIYSSIISYNEYFDEIEKNGFKINDKLFLDYKLLLEKEIEHKKYVDNYRNMVLRTDTRYKLLKKYENKKDEILELYNNKNWASLGNLLKDYLYEIKKFYDMNLVISFDKDIFDITVEYLKNDNQEKLAKYLVDNVPSEHNKNIDFTYNDKGVEHEDQYEDLKKKHVELLTTFDNYCKKYNIDYLGNGGTILGAIRHGGLIPWDDDIDVMMTYDNYNKFLKAIKKDPIKGMKYVSLENTPDYTIHFGRLFDLSSFRIYYTDSLLTSSYGYHLDIFVLDEYIDNSKIRKFNEKLHRLYGQTLNPNLNMFNVDYSNHCRKLELLIKLIGRKNYVKLMSKILYNNRYKKSDKYTMRWRKTNPYSKKLFKDVIYVPFENIEVPIPKDYIDYFEFAYGEDWFVYPLVEERKDIDKIFNLYVPYYMYQDDFLSFIDKGATNNAYHELKYMKMKRVSFDKKIEDSKIRSQFYKDKLEINKNVDIKYVSKLFKQNEYGKIRNYLSQFYYLQLKNSLKDRNLVFILNKEFLYQIIFTLIMTDEFYYARKILNIKKVKELLNDEYNDLMNLMDDSKYIREKSDNEVSKLYQNYPYSITFAVEYFKRINDLKEKEYIVSELSLKYEDFGAVMYLCGLYKIDTKHVKEGKEILELAKDKTRNGLIIFEINKILKK